MNNGQTSITAANSVFMLAVPGLFPVAQKLQGYSAERAWDTGKQTVAEVQMGVDGRLTGGFVPTPVQQTVSLQGDSPSKSIFKSIVDAMRATKDIYYLSGTITLPSTGEAFICARGVLTEISPMPSVGKVLQPVEYMITWESVTPTQV